MFLILISIIFLLSFITGITYASPKYLDKYNNQNKLILKIILWLLIYIFTMFASCYINKVGLPFGNQNIDYNFLSLINDDYIYSFFQTSAIAALAIAILYVIIRYSGIPIHYFIVFLGLMSVLTYYPGIPQSDTSGLYQYYLQNSYSDWQPPMYTIWWHICNSYGAAFIANTISYYAGITIISFYLSKNNRTLQNYCLLFFCANPIFYSQLNIVLKDTLYIGLLSDLVAICLFIQNVKSIRIKIILLLASIIVSFILVGIRYNAILAVIPFTCFILWEIIPNKDKRQKTIITGICTILMSYTFIETNMFVAYNIFNAKKVYSPTLVIYNDLVNIECQTNHKFQIPNQLFSKDYDVSTLRDLMCNSTFINYFNYDPIAIKNWNNIQNPAILDYNSSKEYFDLAKSSWVVAITTHPIEYFKYRIRFVSNDIFAQYYMPAYYAASDKSISIDIYNRDPNNIFTQLQLIIAKISIAEKTDVAKVMGIFIFASIFWFVGLLSSREQCSKISKVIFISNIASLLGLYLVVGEHAARFFFWNDLAGILMIILANSGVKSNQIQLATHSLKKHKKKK